MRKLVVSLSLLAVAGSYALAQGSPRMPVELVDSLGRSDSVTGTWYATIDLPGFGQTAATLSLVQTEASVTGTAAIVGFGAGSLAGNVSGQTLNFTINEVTPCAGVFTGAVALSAGNRSATGSFTGSDCGGSWSATVAGVNLSVGDSAQPSADVLGSWTSTVTISGVPRNAVLTLVQKGMGVTGTAAIVGAGSGALVGTVTGQSLVFTIYEVSPCAGYFIGTVTVSPDNQHANGVGGGNDCFGTYSATVAATKQQQ